MEIVELEMILQMLHPLSGVDFYKAASSPPYFKWLSFTTFSPNIQSGPDPVSQMTSAGILAIQLNPDISVNDVSPTFAIETILKASFQN